MGLSGAAQAAKPAFTAGSMLGIPGGVPEAPVSDAQQRAFWAADKLWSIRASHRGFNINATYDHDITAMKSWAPWARALKQRAREYERMNAYDKLKTKFGRTW